MKRWPHWLVSALVLAVPAALSAQEAPAPKQQPEIEAFERYDAENSVPAGATLFVGSSSINYWKTAEAFPALTVVNRGFGGSTARELLQYRDTLIFKYAPRTIVLYTGENDIAEGAEPAAVIDTLGQLMKAIRATLPCTRVFYLSIKPSMSRIEQAGRQRIVNAAMERSARTGGGFDYVDAATVVLGPDGKPDDGLFMPDRLHLNERGYRLWIDLLGPRLADRRAGGMPAGCPA